MSKKHNMMKYYDSAWKHDSSKSHILLATPYRYTKTSWYQPCSQSSSPPRLQPFIHGQFRPSQVQSHGLRGGFVQYYCHKVWELWNPPLQQESVLDQWKKFKLYIWVWIFARNLLLILSLLGHDDIFQTSVPWNLRLIQDLCTSNYLPLLSICEDSHYTK